MGRVEVETYFTKYCAEFIWMILVYTKPDWTFQAPCECMEATIVNNFRKCSDKIPQLIQTLLWIT